MGFQVPSDRKGQFSIQGIPRNIQYEEALREDVCVIFLGGISTRTLSFKYIFVDEVVFSMRIDCSIEKVPVLAAKKVTVQEHRTVLRIQAGDK